MDSMDRAVEAIFAARKPYFFTGAGVSTLCGIPDFRGPNGLYRDPNVAKMFEIDLFDEDPSYFYRYADTLVYGTDEIKPGPVHLALAALERARRSSGVVTQNIDGLHERAGSSPVYAVHGSAAMHHCRRCGDAKTFDEIVAIRGGVPGAVPRCAKCGGVYKPDITFFGEMLPEDAFSGAMALAASADLVVVLGSSLTVHPAASIPLRTLRGGGRMVIVNRGETPYDDMAECLCDDLKEFADRVFARLGEGNR